MYFNPRPLLCLLMLGSLAANSADKPVSLVERFGARQLLVVRTADWDATQGRLTYYEWTTDRRWRPVLADIPVTVGRHGLAWGAGLHGAATTGGEGPRKAEGDGKAPAGIFAIRGAYGYADCTTRLRYQKVDSTVFCVDDAASPYYNRIVSTDTVRRSWTSAEAMRRSDDQYKYGLFVDYNTQPVNPGAGSCIFFHIWKQPGHPTSGCTAMTEANLLRLLAVLDAKQRPLLVQAPEAAYRHLRTRYQLPAD